MIDNDKAQAMLAFALLSTLFVLSGIRTAGDGLDWDSPRSPVSAVIARNIRGRASCIEPIFHGDFVQSSQRRLLEHPRRAKQVYRSHDYNVARRHRRSRSKLDEGRPYRSSAVKNNEDENEEEEEEEEEEEQEEENEGDEEDKLDDEGADEETAEQADEETVAVAARNRVARSGYVPLGGEADERERREAARTGSASDECEDEPTEPSQYYEYEAEVRNVASHDPRGVERRATLKTLGTSLLILLFT
ncbi:PREDICTED: glutamic acid-rich protein-like [Vollenhovia emeryi]|uniref:glutamic acid-rich protein-like n=1 Tax=Vollenhovia emeryi TaxID=411798 RepID=UPI0005F4A082|nr:PREDICTED: glutamic acid-rich protein-like [Vollenhovia emeryi]